MQHTQSADEHGNQISAVDFTNDGISFATAGKVLNSSLHFQANNISLKYTIFVIF